MQASIGKRALASFTLISLVASGCGARKSAMAPSVGAAPRDVVAAGPAGDPAASSRGAAAETWRRSQIAANTARVMVGDREELPLRGLQAQVTIDGFRARVVLDYLYANPHGGQLEDLLHLNPAAQRPVQELAQRRVIPDRPEEYFRLCVRRDDVGRNTTADQSDGVMRRSELRVRWPVGRAQ